MKRGENLPYKFESLSHLHRVLGWPKPLHPLLSLVDGTTQQLATGQLPSPLVSSFYKISYKPAFQGSFTYGQHACDFDEGGLFCASPNQVVTSGADNGDHSGYMLFIHPTFLLPYPLAKKIKQYGFFSYAANEALHLSDAEKETVVSIFKLIGQELQRGIDEFSQDILIAQLELLLSCTNRFYKRQFITRKAVGHELLQQLDDLLENYFSSEQVVQNGLPTVQYLSEHLHLSASYLSDMLRALTGSNTQQHIHRKLIEKAKEKLSLTTLTVAEIAYELGFEHPQSLSRLFKLKTKQSPVAFRQSFN